MLSERSCREGTNSKIPVDLDVTDLSEEREKRVQAVCVKENILLTDETTYQDRPTRIPPALYEEVRQQLKETLACGAQYIVHTVRRPRM